MSFFLAPALVKLRDEVNERFPNRDKASDGWIGDTSHRARPSDHNPCRTCTGRSNGIVRALDIDISPDGKPNVDLRKRLLKICVGDPRVWYVISNGKIYSRTHGWTAREYLGSNPHFAHVHISLNGANGVAPEGNFDTSDWFPERKPKPLPTRLENFRESRPDWDVNILDRAIANGRIDLQPKVDAIDKAVGDLPTDPDESRVNQFTGTYREFRLLKLRLLDKAVEEGRVGDVKEVRNRLRRLIKSLPER